MNYEKFASDLPLEHSLEFTSAEECEEVLLGMDVNQPLRQLGPGKFRYRLTSRSFDQADLFADRISTAVTLFLEPPAGTVGLLFPRTASGNFRASGIDTCNDKLIVLPGGSGTDIVVPGLAGSEAIAIPEERFTELTETLCATPKPVRLEGMTVIKGNTAQLHSLRRAAVALVANPELENAHEDLSNLISATIDWIGHSSSGWRPEGLDGNAAPIRVAKLAQSHIEEHYREIIRSEELCRLAGVSVRTLQRCFREYFDLSITSYLNTVRLDAAHRELTAAHPQHVSVAEIALRNGHSHLGRFSVHYRKRYGVSPKVTLALGNGKKW